MSVARGKTRLRRCGARTPWARAFSRLAVLLAAFAMFAQLAALPYHHPIQHDDLANVAATLKAEFGAGAVLCAQADDETSSTSPDHRQGHCDEGCPLCQFAAQAFALAAPAPALPARLDIAAAPLTARVEVDRASPRATGLPQPRGPPFEA